MQEIQEIANSEAPEIEKLTKAFRWVTDKVIREAQREIELARALKDRESVIRVQIKMETLKHAQVILNKCHLQITGRRAWHE